MLAAGHAPARIRNHRRLLAGALPIICIIYVWCTYVSLLRDEGQVPTDRRRQPNMHRHGFPVIVGGDLVHWHSICKTCVWYTYVSLLRDEGQVPTDSRRQQNMHRHGFPVVVNREVVQWHGACNVYFFRKRF